MKTIYLIDILGAKTSHQYSSYDELKAILRKNGASIGVGVSIGYGVSIGVGASIGNGVSIGYGASIGKGASIGVGVSIGVGASIGVGVSIGYGVSIGVGASIGVGEKVFISMSIKGSRHLVNWWGLGVIKIGCMQQTIEYWRSEYKSTGLTEGYTEQQINEYSAYIEMIDELQKKINQQKP